jgi:formate hydrogenlyase subunit 6/NADH:ubiquinone oxidoreductase subunit I
MSKNITKNIEEIRNTPIKKRTVPEEYRLAKHEMRQPLCVYCGEPLEVCQTENTCIIWVWSDSGKHYIRDDDEGNAETPFCRECEAADWDFVDGDLVDY